MNWTVHFFPVIELIGAPFDLCGFRAGSRLGPAALRLANLTHALEEIGLEVSDGGDIEVGAEQTADGGIRNLVPAMQAYRQLRHRVGGSLRRGDTPVVLGGDHSTAIGSVGGALEVHGFELAVVWIDAHVDLNSPDTSPSGNLHGMALGALLGMPCAAERLDPHRYRAEQVSAEWSDLLAEATGARPLRPSQVGWYAVRDVDAGEKERIGNLEPGSMATMYEIDRFGSVEMLQRMDRWLRTSGARHVWISFDVDALDPILAPGTGTAVRGGLTYREMHVMGEFLNELLSAPECPYRLAGLDVVEVNPLFDSNNETARTTVEWIASLFGKTILGKR